MKPTPEIAAAVARAGLLVAGGVLASVALFILSMMKEPHWFPFVLLAIGIASLVGGTVPAAEPHPKEPRPPAADLRSRLAELDALRSDGVLSAAEHRRKRKDLLDAWGHP